MGGSVAIPSKPRKTCYLRCWRRNFEKRYGMCSKIEVTDPDVCNIFNLWYLRKHVNEIRREMHRMEHRISMIFTFLGVGFTVLAALITLFQFMG